ncbi:hypothetical protein [Streptomyces violaceusniger]|uniref:hypothetical protein n=1 Tax=Streptomyces violaceusniger TaxID=68280 RepID=UPI0001E4C9AB
MEHLETSAGTSGPDCHISRVEHALGVIRGRWKLLIIHHIGGRYPLKDAAQAHRDIESRTTSGKLLVYP